MDRRHYGKVSADCGDCSSYLAATCSVYTRWIFDLNQADLAREYMATVSEHFKESGRLRSVPTYWWTSIVH